MVTPPQTLQTGAVIVVCKKGVLHTPSVVMCSLFPLSIELVSAGPGGHSWIPEMSPDNGVYTCCRPGSAGGEGGGYHVE